MQPRYVVASELLSFFRTRKGIAATNKYIIGSIAILVLSVCGCTTSSYSEVPQESLSNYVQKEFEYPDLSESEIFIHTMRWFIEEFHVEGSEIRFQDQSAGIIVGDIVTVYYIGLQKRLLKQNITFQIDETHVELVLNNPHDKTIGSLFSGPDDAYLYLDATYSKVIGEFLMKNVHREWSLIIESYATYMSGNSVR